MEEETILIKFTKNCKLTYEDENGKTYMERRFFKDQTQEFPLEVAKSIIANGGGVPGGTLHGKTVVNS